jgi:hypothetical protein
MTSGGGVQWQQWVPNDQGQVYGKRRRPRRFRKEPKASEVLHSSEVGAHDIAELANGLLTVGLGASAEDVGLKMLVDNFSHEAVHCPACCGDELKRLRAARLGFERPFNSFDLAPDTANALEEFIFLANGVSHGDFFALFFYYTPLQYMKPHEFHLMISPNAQGYFGSKLKCPTLQSGHNLVAFSQRQRN